MSLSNRKDRGNWLRVSQEHPCPICQHPDWCFVAADGTICGCTRVEAGSYRSKETQHGTRIYFHRLAGNDSAAAPLIPPRPAGQPVQRAAPEVLHQVYSAFLAALSLSAAHQENLRQRGLPDAEIDRRGYRTLPVRGRARIVRPLQERFGNVIWQVPGFVLKTQDTHRYASVSGPAGLLIPVRDLQGRITALKVRRDAAAADGKYRYLSSTKHDGPSPGAPVHVPLGVTGPCPIVRLTEGELKADVATVLSGLPTIAAPGVANWRPCSVVLQALQAQTVRLSFDMDAQRKAVVAKALSACTHGLIAQDYALELERWAATYNGIDDLLATGQTPEVLTGDTVMPAVQQLAETAGGQQEAAPAAVLTRLQTVLDAGRVEALFHDRELLQELARLSLENPAEFACCRAAAASVKVRLRDLDAALAPLRRELRQATSPPTAAGAYRVVGGRIIRVQLTRDGPVEVPLCNFAGQIVEQITRDDGAERTTRLVVEGALHDGTPLARGEVAAEEFPGMSWVVSRWGARAVLYAGAGTRDHVRTALQLLSGDLPIRVVFTHTGWRQFEDAWHFLHAAGALGSNGPAANVLVDLPEALSSFALPPPPVGQQSADALLASLRLLALAPDRITFPLLAAVYRAALDACDFTVYLAGPTGVFKTELAALCQQHYGAQLNARHLPASWASTGNALEGLAFAAKDALLVIDDFVPTGGPADVQRLHREADRLLRAQGNRAGRQRMRCDTTLRAARPPRGLLLSTGEELPRGHSLRARLFTIEVSPGDVNLNLLTACQRDAAAGLYAAALAAYIQDLASHYEVVRQRLRTEVLELREQAAADRGHTRTPEVVANLAVGLRYLLAFAARIEAIPAVEARRLWDRGWQALHEATNAQAEQQAEAEPTGHFLRLLAAALASGRAHLAGPAGAEPAEQPGCWGWRRDAAGHWQPLGKRIGWVDGEQVYLEPEAAYAETQELARHQGDALAVSPRTLWRRLKERGLLASSDAKRERNTIRRLLGGVKDREVIHLHAPVLSAEQPSAPSASMNGKPETLASPDVVGGRSDSPATQPSAATVRQTAQQPREMPFGGRFGRLATGREGPAATDSSADPDNSWGEV
jgi:hypothetical protein